MRPRYGNPGHPTSGNRYGELEALAATPAQLVVMVYDRLLGAIRRAKAAAANGDQARRSTQLDLARTAIVELLVALDRNQGGDIAGNLASLYAYFLMQLTEAGISGTVEPLDRIIPFIADLRDAFAQAGGVAREQPT